MANQYSRILIENMVQKALKEIKDFPGRGARNLVDMALHFSKGRFQKHFFEIAQDMLHNESSAYYRLVQDIAQNVDHDRIIRLGMNLGYNSCTLGAKQIRKIEDKERFNIPWSITIDIDPDILTETPNFYSSIIEQGTTLGIYTWLLFCPDTLENTFFLAEEHPDCAFVLFSSAKDIDEEIIERAENIHNIMFSINYADDETVSKTCQLLRMNHFPYSFHYNYKKYDVNSILNDDLIISMENLQPIFSFFIADSLCDSDTTETVYHYIKQLRKNQLHPTIAIDLFKDIFFIDSIISDDACTAGFTKEGYLSKYIDNTTIRQYTFFDTSLKDIFKLAFPK